MPVIHVGHKIDRDAVEARADAILSILAARADQATIRAALKIFGKALVLPPVSHIHLENLNIDQSSRPVVFPDGTHTQDVSFGDDGDCEVLPA